MINNVSISNDSMGRPLIFIKQIVFNDDTILPLTENSIVVFTGANNTGKSQVLRDIENSIDDSSVKKMIVIKNVQKYYSGSITQEDYFKSHFSMNSQGYYHLSDNSMNYDYRSIVSAWSNHKLFGDLYKLFVNRLSTEVRLNSSNALIRKTPSEDHPIFKITRNNTIAKLISEYFRQAFGLDLVVNKNEFMRIPLHVGHAPDPKKYSLDDQDEYYNLVSRLPELQDQGDGMRSFASILLNTFTSDCPITLIDEPEAFLHPPQARFLGKMLANNNPQNRQLFISTHSEDFLQGLLDADNKNVIVIRINRDNSINNIKILDNNRISELWGNPILRYSNILSGLFHSKVIVCESDYDCLFYQALINSLFEEKKDIAPDILFVHCGGKQRIKDVVAALKSVKVPVIAIADFDLLNGSHILKPLTDAFDIDWDAALANDMKIIYDVINARGGEDYWNSLKSLGKFGLSGDGPAAFERVDKVLRKNGLFIVPVGEMECFDKTINKQKKDWVYSVLDKYDLASEPKLQSARDFVSALLDYE